MRLYFHVPWCYPLTIPPFFFLHDDPSVVSPRNPLLHSSLMHLISILPLSPPPLLCSDRMPPCSRLGQLMLEEVCSSERVNCSSLLADIAGQRARHA